MNGARVGGDAVRLIGWMNALAYEDNPSRIYRRRCVQRRVGRGAHRAPRMPTPRKNERHGDEEHSLHVGRVCNARARWEGHDFGAAGSFV